MGRLGACGGHRALSHIVHRMSGLRGQITQSECVLVQTRQAIALHLVNVLTLRLPSAVRIALCDRLVDDVGEALGLVFENQPGWGGICVAWAEWFMCEILDTYWPPESAGV